jgi:ABC-type spermidine/putrescine transport system permease subunit I
LAILLGPPVFWLGIIYLGSLFALLLQSFFSIDDFSGLINYEFTLATYRQLLSDANFDIIVRTVTMAAVVTIFSALIAFPSPIMRHVMPRENGRPCSISASCCRSGRAISSRSMPGS